MPAHRSLKRSAAVLSALVSLLTLPRPAAADTKQECAAAYDDAQSLRDKGKLLDARKAALTCSASACSVYVRKDCAQWLGEIEASMPTVVLTAEDVHGADTLDVRVSVDGELVAEHLDGKALPIDPGEHLLRFELAGKPAFETRVIVRQGEKDRRITASFREVSEPTPILLPPVNLPLPSPPAQLPAPESLKPRAPPTWALVATGAGVLLIGAAVGFGVSALAARSDVEGVCKNDIGNCPPNSKAEVDSLVTRYDLRGAMFIGLGVAGAAQLTLGLYGIAAGGRPPRKTTGLLGSSSASQAPSPSSGAVMLTPLVLSRGTGLGLRAAFQR